MRRKVLRFYRDAKGEIRWTFHAANGRKIADSSEGYKKLVSAERGAGGVLGGGLPGQGEVLRGPSPVTGTVDGRADVRVEYETGLRS